MFRRFARVMTAFSAAASLLAFAAQSAHAQNRTMFGNSSGSGVSGQSSSSSALGRSMFGGSGSGGLGSSGSGGFGSSGLYTNNGTTGQNSGFIGRGDQGTGAQQFIGRGDPNATGMNGNRTQTNRNQTNRNGNQRNQNGRGNNNRQNGNGFNNQFGNQFNNANGSTAGQRQIQYQPRQRVDFDYQLPQPASVQTTVTDRLANLTLRSEALRSLDVAMDDNRIVTLRGEVADDRAKRMAELVARMEPGVRGVKNELTIRSAAQ